MSRSRPRRGSTARAWTGSWPFGAPRPAACAPRRPLPWPIPRPHAYSPTRPPHGAPHIKGDLRTELRRLVAAKSRIIEGRRRPASWPPWPHHICFYHMGRNPDPRGLHSQGCAVLGVRRLNASHRARAAGHVVAMILPGCGLEKAASDDRPLVAPPHGKRPSPGGQAPPGPIGASAEETDVSRPARQPRGERLRGLRAAGKQCGHELSDPRRP